MNDFLNHSNLELPIKNDEEINKLNLSKQMISGALVDTNLFIANSILTKYIPGLGLQVHITKRRITLTNLSVKKLFQVAYSNGDMDLVFSKDRTIVRLKDFLKYDQPTTFTQDQLRNWRLEHSFCYDLLVPSAQSEEKFAIMKRDLETYFPIEVKVVKSKRKVYELIAVNGSKKFISKGGGENQVYEANAFALKLKNVSIKLLLNYLSKNLQYLLTDNIINQTFYSGNVDIQIQGDLTDINVVRKQLQQYGLDILEVEREVKVLVIKDRSWQNKSRPLNK